MGLCPVDLNVDMYTCYQMMVKQSTRLKYIEMLIYDYNKCFKSNYALTPEVIGNRGQNTFLATRAILSKICQK